jgi:uncharacterized membrane protein
VPTPPVRDWVALSLAIGTALSLVLVTLAVLVDAIRTQSPLSENATQLLVAVFGGMTGVLGSYLGYRAGFARGQREPRSDDEEQSQPGG